ncbi:MAG TPA: NAD-dependent epimerase/dehydratase family protein [Candidatus Paceibacterota bacterium]|jgi:UDP-glucose 4-epimerase|nr:NAD-dependent epimerase/dehydratase family protein [Candidatus Paceibacterota bacterium]
MTKAVVTGGAGFIGSNIVAALVGKGVETHIVDIDPSFRRDTLPKEATLHEADVRDSAKMQDVFKGADVVYHTAAKPRVPYSIDFPLETTEHNIVGTVSVLNAAVKAGVRRVVYSSSGSSYGNQDTLPLREDMRAMPVHPYGVQKYAGELFTGIWPSIYAIETVSLRYFNVYGPGLDPNGPYALAIGQFLMARKEGRPITIFGDGTVTRDFTHVSDVVAANLLAGESASVGKGEVINVGAGRNVTIQYLAELFGGEIQYAAPRIEAHDSLADNTKARELLGWIPQVQLEDGIAQLKQQYGLS